MSTGPSKEELENYWKTSRSYFDELAQHYKIEDPDYYDKFIAPFYSSPFAAVTGTGKRSSPIAVISAAIAVLLVGVISAVVIFLASGDSIEPEEKSTPEPEKKIEREQINTDTVKTKKETDPGNLRNRKQPYKRVR